MGARVSPAVAALRDVLRNPSIRRIELSWTAGTAADWAFLVVLLVYAYDAGGTLAVGILGAVRTVPAIVAAPWAPTLVERYRGDRVLTAINVVRCAGAVLTAIAIGADVPMEFVFALAAVVAGAGSLVRPIQTALLPAFARTPRELVAANVASSTGEGVGTFVGPLLAGVVVAGTGSVAASLLVAVTFAGAAAAVTGIRFERASDARGGGGADGAKRFRIADAARVLVRYPGAASLRATSSLKPSSAACSSRSSWSRPSSSSGWVRPGSACSTPPSAWVGSRVLSARSASAVGQA